MRDIASERERQISQEGWTTAHDDSHSTGELAAAAACYAFGEMLVDEASGPVWPWSEDWWKPSWPIDRRRDLVKAGALIVAEIERLDRADSHCLMCDDTGYKDYAGFSMDPCDHSRPDGPEAAAEITRLRADRAAVIRECAAVARTHFDIAVAAQAKVGQTDYNRGAKNCASVIEAGILELIDGES